MSRTTPFFVPKKEIQFFDSLNEELIDEIVGQSVDIYKVSIDNTEENVYGESTQKYYEVGFRVNCLIQFDEPEVEQTEFGSDTNSSIEMYFQRNNLSSGSLNFYPETGDTEPQLVAGHPGYKHQIKASAHRARMSSLQIEERPR